MTHGCICTNLVQISETARFDGRLIVELVFLQDHAIKGSLETAASRPLRDGPSRVLPEALLILGLTDKGSENCHNLSARDSIEVRHGAWMNCDSPDSKVSDLSSQASLNAHQNQNVNRKSPTISVDPPISKEVRIARMNGRRCIMQS